jgi:hypothetical protein
MNTEQHNEEVDGSAQNAPLGTVELSDAELDMLIDAMKDTLSHYEMMNWEPELTQAQALLIKLESHA